MSPEASPHVRFRRSLETRDLTIVLGAAAQVPWLNLDDSLEILTLNDLELTATLGHSDVRTTKNIYGHLFPDSGAKIAAKLDAYLGVTETR